MSERALPARRISFVFGVLLLTACQGGGSQTQTPVQSALEQAASGAGQASIHYNGKEYILSLGAAASRPAGGFGLPIPAMAGIQVSGVTEGVAETSASISASVPLAEFMDSFARDYAARGYVRRRYMLAEGMGSAEWLAGKGTVARLYALENGGGVRGKIVALTGGG